MLALLPSAPASNFALASMLALLPSALASNMNGAYLLSTTPGAPSAKSFPTHFDEYPGGGAEYFDVYHGPIKTVYSQVWWRGITNKLPDDVVKRFDGKVWRNATLALASRHLLRLSAVHPRSWQSSA